MEETRCPLVLAEGLGYKSQKKGLWAKLKGFTLCKPDQSPNPHPIPGLARACAEPLLARRRGHLPGPTPAPAAGMGGLRLASPSSFRGAAAVLCVSGLLPPYTPAGSLLAIGPIRAPARPPNSYLRLLS